MTFIEKAKALLQLIRPELPISAGICVVVGQTIALGRIPAVTDLLLGFGLGLFLSSSAMIFNDLFDLEVDRINTPHKPIPSGKVTPTEAIVFGVVTALIALLIAGWIAPLVLVLSLALWILGFLYNWKLKASGLMGNLIVATNVATTFILGGISVGEGSNPLAWIFGAIAFVFDLAEEIAGDAMDMEGDRKRGSRSLAILYGKQSALKISGVLFLVMIVLTLLPVVLGETHLAYILPIGMMDVAIVFFGLRLLKSATHNEGHQAMRGLYISATIGLVAFILSRFVG
ncbi:MAG: prenyltransferase [Chloroflexi bacterium HGW-Chloroflexi-3]|nr:MAG: prenyltransferase [Chloroflexi bacterium HGW-Chloroflexi-3]